MGVKVSNNAFGTLSAGISSSDTTVTLDSGQGARFPTLGAGDYFYGTIVDTSNNLEIVKVTARSTDSMTVVRGQDDTTARAYVIGDRFELRPVAALFEDIDLGDGGTISGVVDIESTAAEALHITGTEATQVRVRLENTTAGVQYSYYEAKTDSSSGYLIHNGTGGGNSLAAGETYVWSSPGKVSLVPAGTIANKLEVNTNGDVTINGKMFGGGLVLLGQSSWTSNTTGAIFDVFDYTKYTTYVLYWMVDHSPSWTTTYLRFRNSSGDISSTSYWNNVRWRESTASADTINSVSYAGNQNFAWLAGNGTGFNSHGTAIITVPRNGSSRTGVRGMSQLQNRTTHEHYEEEFASTLEYTNPHTGLTGVHLYGVGGNSSYGDFQIFGVER